MQPFTKQDILKEVLHLEQLMERIKISTDFSEVEKKLTILNCTITIEVLVSIQK